LKGKAVKTSPDGQGRRELVQRVKAKKGLGRHTKKNSGKKSQVEITGTRIKRMEKTALGRGGKGEKQIWNSSFDGGRGSQICGAAKKNLGTKKKKQKRTLKKTRRRGTSGAIMTVPEGRRQEKGGGRWWGLGFGCAIPRKKRQQNSF